MVPVLNKLILFEVFGPRGDFVSICISDVEEFVRLDVEMFRMKLFSFDAMADMLKIHLNSLWICIAEGMLHVVI